MRARVTMRDVARAVGRSPMTVSRALRGDETVSVKTRALISKTAADLGYVYDSTAQAFRTQKSGFVAVTLPSINNANFAETFRGLSTGLEASGIQLLLGSTNYQVEKENELVRQLLARKPEALIVTGGYHLPETRSLLENAHVPVIETWDLPPDPLGSVVGFSNENAVTDVVQHLHDQGRRRIAFIGAAAGRDMRGTARRDGVVAAAQRLGLPDVAIVDAGQAPVSMRQGVEAIKRLGKNIAKFDALICVSDPVAFGVLSECKRMSVNVPEDIAVTGFGNFDVAMVSNPQITTVDVHANEIGRKIAEVLLDVIDGNTQPRHIDVGSQLVLGETS
ncbi:MAG: LacI family DNA-binding transcriptional regulator [Roseobacter sp.]